MYLGTITVKSYDLLILVQALESIRKWDVPIDNWKDMVDPKIREYIREIADTALNKVNP